MRLGDVADQNIIARLERPGSNDPLGFDTTFPVLEPLCEGESIRAHPLALRLQHLGDVLVDQANLDFALGNCCAIDPKSPFGEAPQHRILR